MRIQVVFAALALMLAGSIAAPRAHADLKPASPPDSTSSSAR
jgi:hypothetical protein